MLPFESVQNINVASIDSMVNSIVFFMLYIKSVASIQGQKEVKTKQISFTAGGVLKIGNTRYWNLYKKQDIN